MAKSNSEFLGKEYKNYTNFTHELEKGFINTHIEIIKYFTLYMIKLTGSLCCTPVNSKKYQS